MKIENRSGIPDSLFRYLSTDNYDYDVKGDSYSVTEILNPIQQIILKRRHRKEIVIDAIDRLWIVLGNGVHKILEDEKGIEKIERLKVKVLDKEVSGKWDRIYDNKITDYKVTSAVTVKYGSRKEEWMLQLSIYRWLYFKVKGVLLEGTGYIVAILRDWSAKDIGGSYPKAPGVEIPLKLLSPEASEEWVKVKMIGLIAAEGLDDLLLPECTDKERWYQKASHVYMRCAKYCEASPFCAQLKREKEREVEDVFVEDFI